jgi:hypothetical protein
MNWLLLITEVPSAPGYLRVKLRRRVQRLGAIGLKGAVYVLPELGESAVDFRELREEIVGDGGDATICRATMMAGMTDSDLEAAFNGEREIEYAGLIAACTRLSARWPAGESGKPPLLAERTRLFARLEEILTRDFFGCDASEAAMQAIERLALLS